MAPISSGKQRMNQFLQDRRKKINQNKQFRKQRIIKHYRKAIHSYDQQLSAKLNPNQTNTLGQNVQKQSNEVNPQVQRKINFYNSVFQEPHVNQRLNKNKKNKKNNRNSQNSYREFQPKGQKELIEQKLSTLKEKNVKFIKKMGKQKTAKGQPVMRNMISYALTKIEETIHKEKLQKLVAQEASKKQGQRSENSQKREGTGSFSQLNKQKTQAQSMRNNGRNLNNSQQKFSRFKEERGHSNQHHKNNQYNTNNNNKNNINNNNNNKRWQRR